MSESERPVLRVVKGDATPEEVAAIVAVVSALGGPSPEPRRTRSRWAWPSFSAVGASGAGAWKASARL